MNFFFALLLLGTAVAIPNTPLPAATTAAAPFDTLADVAIFPEGLVPSNASNTEEMEVHSNYRRFFNRQAMTCETSSASPPVEDVMVVAAWLQLQSGYICVVKNRFGSRCTKLVDYGGASASVCGTWHSWLPCTFFGYLVQVVAEECQENGLAGGKVTVNQGLQIAVH